MCQETARFECADVGEGILACRCYYVHCHDESIRCLWNDKEVMNEGQQISHDTQKVGCYHKSIALLSPIEFV